LLGCVLSTKLSLPHGSDYDELKAVVVV